MLHALALLAAAGASAAMPEPSPPAIEDTLVVTASLAEEPAEDTPAAVTVVDATEIAARQTSQAADVLRTVAGLDIVRSGSPGKATSLFSRGHASNQTLVLWNGVELNDPFFAGFDWAFLPTDGVERLEVVRGPVGVLYGSDTIGGVVQLLSGPADGVRVAAEGGDDGYRRGSVTAGLDLGTVRFEAAGHLRRGDGEIDNDGYDGEEAMALARWAATDALSVGVLARASAVEVGLPFDFFGSPSPRRIQDRDTTQLAVPVRWQGERWDVEGQVARHALDLSVNDPDDPFAASESEAEALDARAVARRRFGGRGWVAFGADWRREEATSRTAFGPGLSDDRQRTWSGFGEARFDRGPWALDLGLRRDDNDTYGSETTGRTALLRRLGEHRIRVSWGEGFRAPSLGDLFFPGFGNPDLEPERSETWDLGWTWSRGAWSAAAAVFDTEVENLIVFDFVTGLPQNIGRATTRGVEAETAWRGEHAWIRGAATRLEAEDAVTGEALVRRPDWRASIVGGWQAESWSLTGTGRYVGERTDLGAVTLDSYTTIDVAARWQALPTLAPYARVENLFDERYEEAAGFPAADRALVVGLAWAVPGS